MKANVFFNLSVRAQSRTILRHLDCARCDINLIYATSKQPDISIQKTTYFKRY